MVKIYSNWTQNFRKLEHILIKNGSDGPAILRQTQVQNSND